MPFFFGSTVRPFTVMLRSLAVLLLACPLALAQENTPPPEGSKASQVPAALPSTSTLPANYPVITVRNLCPPGAADNKSTKPSPKSYPCAIVITRAQFERLVNAIDPGMPKGERHQLAETYGSLIYLAREAERRGLDKKPEYQEKLRYDRLRLLAAEASADIYHESMKITEPQVEAYYKQHEDKFRRYDLERIFVPSQKQPASSDPDATTEEMKALAAKIRARAAAGEDFAKLQKEVSAEAGLPATFDVKLKDSTRSSLPKGHGDVLDLAPGKVSETISDPSGYYIYKVVSSTLPPLSQVRQLAELDLQSATQTQALTSIRERAQPEVSSDYFDKYDPPPAKESESDLESD